MIDVSVIMPCYNVEKYLDRSLESICGQSLFNTEIICVDDGSSDQTFSIINEWMQRDSRVIGFRFEKNRGQSAARNLGIQVARGRYVYFMDSDDELERTALEKLLNEADKNDCDVVLFEGIAIKSGRVIYTIERPIKEESVCSGKELFQELHQTSGLDNYLIVLQFWKRSYLEKLDLSFYEGIVHEDILFTFVALLNANRVSFVKEKWYKYYINQGTTTTQAVTWKHVQSLIVVLDEIIKYIEQNSESLEECDEAVAAYAVNVYNHYKIKVLQSGLQLRDCTLSGGSQKESCYTIF